MGRKINFFNKISMGFIIFITMLFILFFSFVVYPKINMYEPIKIKIISHNICLSNQVDVYGITPFERSFNFYYATNDSAFIADYGYLREIKISIDKEVVDSSLSINLKRGSRIFNFNEQSFKATWHLDSTNAKKYFFSNPSILNHKNYFNAFFSIFHWKLINVNNVSNLLRSITLPLVIVVLPVLFLMLVYYFLHKKYNKSKYPRSTVLLIYSSVFGLLATGMIFFYVYELNDKNSIASLMFLVLAILCILFVILIFVLKKTFSHWTGLLLMVSSLTYFYIFSEFVLMVGVKANWIKMRTDNNVVAYNKPPIIKDRISGYKYNNGLIHIIRCNEGKVVFDNYFFANNKGYVSRRDYNYKKERNTYRFLVLGDSFTAGEYLQIPWPTQAENSINTKKDSINVELYSFALGGFGLLNWYSQFFYEIIPNYEFDALIIATFASDFERDFLIAESRDSVCYNCSIDDIVLDSVEFNNIPVSQKNAVILSNREIDLLNPIRNLDNSKPNNFIFTTWIYKKMYDFELVLRQKKYYDKLAHNKKFDDSKNYTSHDFIERYGIKRWHYINDIINYCRINRKPVIICSTPAKELVIMNEKKKTVFLKELEYIADTFNLNYFDSYPYFEKLSKDTLNSYFIQNDGHWNQKGSDFFSMKFSKFLINFINKHRN